MNLGVKIGKLKLNNPVLVASGTFGYGKELGNLINLNKLGGIITKTITLKPKKGNPMPRTIEAPCGLINSIGLENQGIDEFLKEKIPFLKRLKTAIIVSIGAEQKEGFVELARRLDKEPAIDAIEINISCPNLSQNLLIAQDPSATYKIVKLLRKATKKTLITKLSPNVTDITEIAQAAKEAGSDALSLINTIFAMGVDAERRRPVLGNVVGGLSGPAIKPIALYNLYRVKSAKIPIIAMGGIMDASDALEFLITGATAVALGTANFVNPKASLEVIAGIKRYMVKHKIKNIKNLIGSLRI